MQKILVVLDGMNPAFKVMDFVCYLGGLTKSAITGMFLNISEKQNLKILNSIFDQASPGGIPASETETPAGRLAKIQDNITRFKEACCRREVNCEVNCYTGIALEDLIRESEYADLIILDAETSFGKKKEGSPTSFVKALLKRSDCPVILAPDNFEGIDEIIYFSDARPTSFYAIKQFHYLFSELRNKKMILVAVRDAPGEISAASKRVQDWFEKHFSNTEYLTLYGDPKVKLLEFLIPHKNAIVVMGAYGHANLSNIFKESVAEMILKTIDLPVFISHFL